MSNPVLKVKRLISWAKLPTLAEPDAACYDLYSAENKHFRQGETALIDCGIAIECPQGWYAQIYVRSSTPLKKGFILSNGVGVIDNSYRGTIYLQLTNIKEPFFETGGNDIRIGDRIGQIKLFRDEKFNVEWAEELSETVRGTGGHGSTG